MEFDCCDANWQRKKEGEKNFEGIVVETFSVDL
jgi:hypothetical protein